MSCICHKQHYTVYDTRCSWLLIIKLKSKMSTDHSMLNVCVCVISGCLCSKGHKLRWHHRWRIDLQSLQASCLNDKLQPVCVSCAAEWSLCLRPAPYIHTSTPQIYCENITSFCHIRFHWCPGATARLPSVNLTSDQSTSEEKLTLDQRCTGPRGLI